MPAAPNTSATGGPLSPLAVPAPLQGQALNRFFQQWVAGIVGIDDTLVRTSFQGEPPNIPPAATAWVALQVTTVPADVFPAVIHRATGGDDHQGVDELQRNEMINLLASFYDTGVDGQAQANASVLRDGLAIAQNREVLYPQGMALNSVGTEIQVPTLFKERWLYRMDLPFIVARQVTRQYRVQNVVEGVVEIVTSAGSVLEITVVDDT